MRMRMESEIEKKAVRTSTEGSDFGRGNAM